MKTPSAPAGALLDSPPLVGAHLPKSVGLIIGLSLLTLALGFAVQVVLAAQLGTSREMDAYLVAITLPTLVTGVAIIAFTLVLVPVLKEKLILESPEEVSQNFFQIFNLVGLVMLLPVAIIIARAAWAISLAAPGFSSSTIELSAGLLRIMIVGTFFDVQRAVLTAFYYARERFFLPQLVPSLNHLILGSSALFLLKPFGTEALAWGWALGSLTMFAVLFANVAREYRWTVTLSLRDSGLRRFLRLLFPALVVALVGQATPVIDRLVASTLPAGSISFLGYGSKVLEMLMRTAPMGVVLALFPTMSGLAAARDWRGLKRAITVGVRWVVLAAVPLALLVAVLREPLVTVLFQRGAFGEVATAGVSAALGWYAIAFIPASVVYLAQHVFFAVQRPGTLVWVGLLALALTAVLDWSLSRFWGFLGIAGAYLAVSVITGLTLTGMLRQGKTALDVWPGARWLARVLAAAGVMAGSLFAVGRLASGLGGQPHYAELVMLASMPVGLVAYLTVLRWTGVAEIQSLAGRVREMAASATSRPR